MSSGALYATRADAHKLAEARRPLDRWASPLRNRRGWRVTHVANQTPVRRVLNVQRR
jgi:hypothetical protein